MEDNTFNSIMILDGHNMMSKKEKEDKISFFSIIFNLSFSSFIIEYKLGAHAKYYVVLDVLTKKTKMK
jgi:hypothetical protein